MILLVSSIVTVRNSKKNKQGIYVGYLSLDAMRQISLFWYVLEQLITWYVLKIRAIDRIKAIES